MTKEPSRTPYLPPVFLGSLAFVLINFGLPIRADDLGINAVLIGGMYAIFTGTLLIARPLIGYCLDRFGRRYFFSVAFVFYAAAMTVFSGSSDLGDFYLARFLQGIGASLMWVTARTMIADLNDSESRGKQMGLLTTTSVRGSMLGAFYGFTLMGFLPLSEAWFFAFAGYGIAALVAMIWAFAKVPETRPEVSSENADTGKLSFSVFQIKGILPLFVVVFTTAFASALIEPIYLIFLKNKFDLALPILAALFLPAGLVHAILPRYSGQWSDRWGRAPIIALGVVLAGLVSMALPWWSVVWLIAVSYIFFAVGWAMASPAIDAKAADLAPEHVRGTVLGMKEAAMGLGAALGPLAGGYIFEYWSQELAFVLNGVLLILTALFVLKAFRGQLTTQSSFEEAA